MLWVLDLNDYLQYNDSSQYNYLEIRYISGIQCNKRWPIVYIERPQVIFSKKKCILSLTIECASGSALFAKIRI